jgi:hypothetical protein
MRLFAATLLSATCALSATRVWAQDAPYCAAGQTLDWQPVLVSLSQRLGDTMGQPLECPHPSGDSDDIIQQQQDVASDLTYVNSVVFVHGQLYAAAEDRVVLLSDFGPQGKANLVQTIVEHLSTRPARIDAIGTTLALWEPF